MLNELNSNKTGHQGYPDALLRCVQGVYKDVMTVY